MELDTSEQVSPFNNCILCFVGFNWCFEISAFQSILPKIFDLIGQMWPMYSYKVCIVYPALYCFVFIFSMKYTLVSMKY